MSYRSRLKKAFTNAPVLPWHNHSRYVLFSDCHRGNGTSNDNFFKNQHLYFTALKYYYQLGYTYIELGDGDELWENRKISQIIEIHNNVFWLLSLFHQKKRLYLLYGNHDMEKKRKRYSDSVCPSYFCTDTQCMQPLFPGLTFYESIILENKHRPFRLHLTHGHQADFLNSVLWKLSRFLVRYLWKPLEHIGFLDPTSAAKNYTCKEKIEKRLTRFATVENIFLICGHTHRPMLNAARPHYMNTGSCVHPRCITCIEVNGPHMLLVKWTLDTKKDRTLYVAREVLSEIHSISSINSQVFPVSSDTYKAFRLPPSP